MRVEIPIEEVAEEYATPEKQREYKSPFAGIENKIARITPSAPAPSDALLQRRRMVFDAAVRLYAAPRGHNMTHPAEAVAQALRFLSEVETQVTE